LTLEEIKKKRKKRVFAIKQRKGRRVFSSDFFIQKS
jgi:hypothetical protein